MYFTVSLIWVEQLNQDEGYIYGLQAKKMTGQWFHTKRITSNLNVTATAPATATVPATAP